MSGIDLKRVALCADYGVNFRSIADALLGLSAAKKAGFGWVGYHVFDPEHIPTIRGAGLQEHYAKTQRLGAYWNNLMDAARSQRIGLMLTAFTPYVLENACRAAGAVKVPLSMAKNQVYWARLTRAMGHPIVLYETASLAFSAAAGRVPMFVSPGWPAKEEEYLPYFTTDNPVAGRVGLSLHAPSREAFLRAACIGSPFVSLPVMPDDYPDAPDKAISTAITEAAGWVAELREAEADLEKNV